MIIDSVIECIKTSPSLQSKDDKERLKLLKKFTLATNLKVQNVANYILQENPKEQFDYIKDFPNSRPPWPVALIQWKTPAFTFSDAKGRIDVEPWLRCDFTTLIDTHEIDKETIGVFFYSFFTNPKGDSEFIGFNIWEMDHKGHIKEHIQKPWVRMINGVLARDDKWKELLSSFLTQTEYVGLMTMNFLNCKNVQLEANHLEEGIAKRRKRMGRVLANKYYTLKISNRTEIKGSSNNGTSENQNRFHIRRGHFKNFTEERPLLGKHVGTYWWEMHTAGNKDQGSVVKDYELKDSS